MNRRGFLSAVGALFAAPCVPASTALGWRGFVGWKSMSKPVVLNDQWVGFIHTSYYEDLIGPAPVETGSLENVRFIELVA